MTTFSVLRTLGSAALYSPQRLKLKTIMQGQSKKKKIYDVQTRQLSIQILGNGSDSSSRSLLLVADKMRYMFNCGESTQRDFQQLSTKLLHTKKIFLTSANWENLGGLSATLLMIDRATTGTDVTKEVSIYGPKNMQRLLKCLQSFVQLRHSNVSFNCSNDGVIYIDNSIAIKCMQLRDDSIVEASKELGESITSSSDEGSNHSCAEDKSYTDNNSKRKISTDHNDEQELKKQKTIGVHKTTNRVPEVFCYVCELKDVPGKMLIEKCIEKGVPQGPLLTKLKAGQDITLDDGTIVLAKDVCLAPKAGPAIMILECPTENYINSLINQPMIRHYQSSKAEKELLCIFHFTPENVLQNPEYQAWMKQFKNNTHHVILNGKNKRSVIESSRKLQCQLNLLDPEIFPLFPQDFRPMEENKAEESNPYFHRAEPQMRVWFQPELKFETKEPECDLDGYVAEAMAVEGFAEVLDEVRSKISSAKYGRNPCMFPRVVFLGTASALGSTVRNVSSILLRIDEEHNILLDCGDGTVRQIYTLYGLKKGTEIISKIKGIFVSHMHADHHSGLIGILKERAKLTDEPTRVIGPALLYDFLDQYDTIYESVCGHFSPTLSADFLGDQSTGKTNLYKALNVSSIKTAKVMHTAQSYAIRLTLRSGFSIAYSGDTRPCDDMIKLAWNVDLLLHEATMGANLLSKAIATKHSTIPEALGVVMKSQAKHAILTHVSQRYSKVPIVRYDKLPENVGVAYDFMDISVNDLPLLNDIYHGAFALHNPEADKFSIKNLKALQRNEMGKATG